MSRKSDNKAKGQGGAKPGVKAVAPTAPTQPPVEGLDWRFPAIIAGAILLAYANTYSSPFVFDDEFAITNNTTIRSLWPIWRAFWGPDETGVSGRPIVNFSFALNYAVSQYAVCSYHLFNIAIHIGSALALFGVARRTLLLPRHRERWGAVSRWGAFALALLWALHPLQTESVAYIIARNESLMGMFYLLTLYCFIRSLDSPRPIRWKAASWCACLLGMASKEAMATAPLLVLLYDGCLAAGSWDEIFKRRWRYYASLAATWILLGVLISTGPRQQTVGFGLKSLSPIEYLMVEGGVILTYFKLSFWPAPLVFDYGWFTPISWGEAIVPMIVVGGLVAASLAAIRVRPALGFLGASIFLILGPTSSVMPIAEPMWEYRMYLPLASVLALALLAARAIWLRAMMDNPMPLDRKRALAIYILAGVALACSAMTFARNRDYRTEFLLIQDTLAKNPKNPRALSNMGQQLMKQGRFEEATHFFTEATRLRPAYADAHYNLGTALLLLGRRDEALPSLEMAVAIEPRHAKARNNLGMVHLQKGEFAAAVTEFETSIGADPGWIQPRLNLCVAVASSGRRDEAEAMFAEIRTRFPDSPERPASLDALLASHRR